MYWGRNFTGGHSANGVPAAGPRWYFAEGAAAPFFDTYYTLLNPNPFPVSVEVRFLTAKGLAPVRSKTVAANSRDTVHLNSELGNVGAVGASFTTVGGHGIVVERSIYWGAFPNWVEGTNDVGATAPAQVWNLPEGSDAGLFDSYFLIANPNPFPVSVRVQFYLDGGGRISAAAPLLIPALSRVNINMGAPTADGLQLSNSDVALLTGKSYGVRLESLTPDGPILVEGAVYRDYREGTYWRAGASSFGIPQ
jgi:hypothetical protein